MLSRFPKSDPIWEISNPRTVQRKANWATGKKISIQRTIYPGLYYGKKKI